LDLSLFCDLKRHINPIVNFAGISGRTFTQELSQVIEIS